MKNIRKFNADHIFYHGWIIHIDRTRDIIDWATRKGLAFIETIETSDSREKFNVYMNSNNTLAVAIPA